MWTGNCACGHCRNLSDRRRRRGYTLCTNALDPIFHGTIAAALINKITLLGRGADAAHIGRIGGGAAAGLGLVITEDEEAVGARLELGAEQRLIGIRIAPCAHGVLCAHAHIIKGADGLILLPCATRILQEIGGESLHRTGTQRGVDHDQICYKNQQQTRN